MIEQLLDLNQLLLEFVAPAFSPIGTPARRVGKLLRALLLLNIKNVRSEKFLVNTELIWLNVICGVPNGGSDLNLDQ